jgi:hypothetical protein
MNIHHQLKSLYWEGHSVYLVINNPDKHRREMFKGVLIWNEDGSWEVIPDEDNDYNLTFATGYVEGIVGNVIVLK